MSTQENVSLFEDEVVTPVITKEVEDQLSSLLAVNFISLKKEQLSQAVRFFGSQQQMNRLRPITSAMTQTGREKEYPQVYEPIIQIEAFEKTRIPLLFKEDGEIEAILSKVLMYFFPTCTVERDDAGYSLHLNSVPFRRYSYFANLVKENSSWVGFVSEKFPIEYSSNEAAQTIMAQLKNYVRERSIGRVEENPIAFEESFYNYEEVVLWIPHQASAYMEKFQQNNNAKSSNFFFILDLLVQFSHEMHFVSDSYREINNAVNEEFEKEKRVYTEKQQQAVVQFEKELERHIIPVSRLNHKSAVAYAKANNIENVLVPFENMGRMTNDNSVGLSVYVREDEKRNQDWLILPPTKEVLEFKGMEYQGVLNYVNYETTSYLATKQKAPHVVGTDSMLNTMIDEQLFMQVLLDHYEESPSYAAILASYTILNEFPKAFSKVAEAPGSDNETESKPSRFSDWISHSESAHEEVASAPEGSLSDSLTLLKTTIGQDEEKKAVMQVGSLIISAQEPVDEDSDEDVDDFEKLVRDALFEIKKVDLVQENGVYTVFLDLHTVSTINSESHESDIRLNLKDFPMLIADASELTSYLRFGTNTDDISSPELEAFLITGALKHGIVMEAYLPRPVVEQMQEVEDEEWIDVDDDGGMSASDILDAIVSTPAGSYDMDPFPSNYSHLTSEFVYRFNVETNNFFVYKNRLPIYCVNIPSPTVDKIKEEFFKFIEDKQVTETGVTEERPYILPIYNNSGNVLTAIPLY